MMPFESASRSLRLGEDGPPMVGGDVWTSGGQAACGCVGSARVGGLSLLDCAAAALVPARLTSNAIMTAWRKSILPQVDE